MGVKYSQNENQFMKNQFLISTLFLLMFSSYLVLGQSYPMGMIDNGTVRAQYDALELAPSPPSKSGEASLNQVFEVDLSQFAPSVGNQGEIGSCVGWSTSNAITISNAMKYGWTKSKIDSNALSALYIYNNIKLFTCDYGSSLYDAGRWLVANGDCSRLQFDTDVNNCEKKEDDNCKNAKRFIIKEFLPLFYTDALAKERILKTKKSLVDSIPVVVGVDVKKNFFKPQGEYWDPLMMDTTYAGGHAMCVVGFSDARKAFKVLNSWGKEWGNDGYIWIKYGDYKTYCKYAYQYIVKENDPIVDDPVVEESDQNEPVVEVEVEKEKIIVTGQFDFEFFTFNENNKPVPNLSKAKYLNGYQYELEKSDWEYGDLFRFILKDVPKQRYVYAFSVDASGLNVHYPRGIEFDEEKDSYSAGESPIVLKRENIIVPTPDTALKREEDGNDSICILYAAKKIGDFKQRITKLRSQTKGKKFDEILSAHFGDILIDQVGINYNKNKMSFKATSVADNFVVPIFVTIN